MKYHIFYNQENCSGCLRCQLACSWAYAKCFQPSVAHIRLDARGESYHVSFSDECLACGACVDNCLFNALTKRPKEGEA